MAKSRFVYVIYIRTTPEKLWKALTMPEFNRQFFYGTFQESKWKKGATWRLVKPDGGPVIAVRCWKLIHRGGWF